MTFEELQKRFKEAVNSEETGAASLLSEESGIGIKKEKRLHRIIKRTVCESENELEVKVGRYTADVLTNGVIYEIQCGGLLPLKPKIAYYLQNTSYSVCIIRPVIEKRMIIRADRETGEILRQRRSPRKNDFGEAVADLYPVSEFLTSPRVTVKIMLISAEEYRYSERMRYRKEGRYDSELFPAELCECIDISRPSHLAPLIPGEFFDREFTASEIAPTLKLKGRSLYSALNTMKNVGLLTCRKEKRSNIYRIAEEYRAEMEKK